MQWLASLSVRRAVFASVLVLVIVVFGLVGYSRLGVDKFPQVDFPVVTVSTVYKGASPSAVESDVTDLLEGVVNTVSGVEQLTSISSEGLSTVIVQFTLEKDGDVATQEVRDRVSSVIRWPSNGTLKSTRTSARLPCQSISRHCPVTVKRSSGSPLGSITPWHMLQVGFLRCSSSI